MVAMKIVTLTLNPAIDKSATIQALKPDSKLRCSPPVYHAGGGGINVSRAIHKLGSESLCTYLSGGPEGQMMHQLLDEEGIQQHVIPIAGRTRENFIVVDTSREQQYRFGMPGPPVSNEEIENMIQAMEQLCTDADIVVASGTLPPEAPKNLFARVASIAKRKSAKCIIDTSGDALIEAANEGVYLLKPNLGELSALSGKPSITALEQEKLASQLIEEGKCEVVVVSLGPQGAMLVARNEKASYIPAPTVHKKSTVGAGDSMVAGMVLSLAQNKSLKETVLYGVAAGTAATMNEGTNLCKKEDTERLFQWIKSKM